MNEKFLVYTVCDADPAYLHMLKLLCKNVLDRASIPLTFLVITSKQFYAKNKDSFPPAAKVFTTAEVVDNAVKASMLKLRVYDWPGIMDYSKVLYLDLDMACVGDVAGIFREDLCINKIYGLNSSANSKKAFTNACFTLLYPDKKPAMTAKEIKELEKRNINPIHTGLFLFANSVSMKKHFQNIQWLTKHWNGWFFYEQSYVNWYFAKMFAIDANILQQHAQACVPKDILRVEKKLFHHIGGAENPLKKIHRIENTYKSFRLKEHIEMGREDFEESAEWNNGMRIGIPTDVSSGMTEWMINLARQKRDKALLKEKTDTPIANGRTLVYTTTFGSFQYADMTNILYDSIMEHCSEPDKIDFHVITDPEGFKSFGFDLPGKVMIAQDVPSVFSRGELSVRYGNNILQLDCLPKDQHQTIVFLDSDIVFVGDIMKIISQCKEAGVMYSVPPEYFRDYDEAYSTNYWSLKDHQKNPLWQNGKAPKTPPVNGGVLMWKNTSSMLEHLNNIGWMMRCWHGRCHFEQSFLCWYFGEIGKSRKIDMGQLVKPEFPPSKGNVFYHFLASDKKRAKIDRMLEGLLCQDPQ